jgi:exopolysaccharide biosynthesis polyprenyl glycosylphosphotransferase
MSYQPFRRKILLETFKLFDLLVMVFAFGLATVASYYQTGAVSFSDFLSMRIKIQNFGLFLGFLIAWHIIFSLFGLYHSRRFSTRLNEAIDVIKATSIGSFLIYAASILLKIWLVTPIFVAVFWIGSSAITILSRLALRYTMEWARLRGRNLRHMLIVGTNPRAIQFAQKIEAKPDLGYRVIGFVDDEYAENGAFKKSSYELVASLNNISTYLKDHVVDEVVISLPMKSFYDQASRIVTLCEEQGVIVRFLSNMFNLKPGLSKVDRFEDDSVITVTTGTIKGIPALIKRAMDLSASLILLTILAPFFLVMALLIRFSSPGPIFFVQERIGVNKRRFRLYKFRTMLQDAEKKLAELEDLNEVSGPVFKIKNDPRITRAGKFLRKTSVDELPQLINVLKGDMSLVGPRPLPVRDYNGFDEDWHRRRFSVRPGITCLWQINGRSNVSFEKWMKLDMEYIDNWSLLLDFKILAKTLPAVLKGSGAA